MTPRSWTDVALALVAALVLGWAVLGTAGESRTSVALLALPMAAALVVARRWPIPAVALSLPGSSSPKVPATTRSRPSCSR